MKSGFRCTKAVMSQMGQNRTKVTIDLLRAFDWCQNQRPWITSKGHYTLCFKLYASFVAYHKIRPIL